MLDLLLARAFILALIGNLALLGLILLQVPRSLRLHMEAEYLRQQAELLKAQIEMEKLRNPEPSEAKTGE